MFKEPPKISCIFTSKDFYNSVTKLSKDECYPQSVMDEFKSYEVGSLDKFNHSYEFIKECLLDFYWRCWDFFTEIL